MNKKNTCDLPVPFSDDEIASILDGLPDVVFINGVRIKRDETGYYQSRTGNALVRLALMLMNGRIYAANRDGVPAVGLLMDDPLLFLAKYDYSAPDVHTKEFAMMAGEPLYRSCDISSLEEFLYMCAIAQLYVFNVRQT